MDKYLKFYNDFISKYDLSIEKNNKKKNHTFKVVENCNYIARSLNLNEEEIFLANLIGLFHDIGRFVQLNKYGKFRDYETEDHALLSNAVLKENHILDDYKYKDIVYKAIENHNKLNIETGLDDQTMLFCKIIRDADKLDIINEVIEGVTSLNSFNDDYSKDAVENILNGYPINPSIYPDLVDKSLVKIGLLNDINFNCTKEYILNNNMIEKLKRRYLQSNPGNKDSINLMFDKIKERLGNDNARKKI